jgi:hypothetical protein
MENWKQCIESPFYEVSDLGRVRRRTPACRTRPGKLLQGRDPGLGYIQYLLATEPNKYRQFLGHRLVMSAFVGPSDLHVNHKNGRKADNRLCNLEYVTAAENSRHSCDVLGKHFKGERNPRAKLTEAQVLEILDLSGQGWSQRALCRRFKISKGMIYNIQQGRAWSHLAMTPRPPNFKGRRTL